MSSAQKICVWHQNLPSWVEWSSSIRSAYIWDHNQFFFLGKKQTWVRKKGWALPKTFREEDPRRVHGDRERNSTQIWTVSKTWVWCRKGKRRENPLEDVVLPHTLLQPRSIHALCFHQVLTKVTLQLHRPTMVWQSTCFRSTDLNVQHVFKVSKRLGKKTGMFFKVPHNSRWHLKNFCTFMCELFLRFAAPAELLSECVPVENWWRM